MSPHTSVICLRTLALNEVSNLIINNVSVTPTQLDEMKSYLFGLPTSIRRDVLECILNTEVLGTFLRFNCLNILLDHSITSVATGSFPENYYTRVLKVLENQGTGLRCLDLRGVWLKKGDSVYLCRLLERLPDLRILRVPHIATDAILKTIGVANKNLQVLDISGESLISHEGIEEFCLSHLGLEILDVGRPGDCDILKPKSLALIIKCMTKLISIGCYSFVGQALLNYVSEGWWNGEPINLHYLHDTDTDAQTLDIITMMCPHLYSIYLDRPQTNTILNLQGFLQLSHLKLSRFAVDELTVFLMNCGRGLKCMDLILGHGVFDVSVLAKYCSQLTNITFYKVEHLVHFKEFPFHSMRRLKIFYSTLSTSCLKYLVCNSKKLEHVTLYCNFVIMSDELVRNIFPPSSCILLKTIWISNATLSREGVETLIAKCPNLRKLGYAESWGLSQDDIELLRLHIRINNLDLYLAL